MCILPNFIKPSNNIKYNTKFKKNNGHKRLSLKEAEIDRTN